MTHVYLSALVPLPDIFNEVVFCQGVQEDHVATPDGLVQEVGILALTGFDLSPQRR